MSFTLIERDWGNLLRLEWPIDRPPGHAVAYLLDGKHTTLIDAGMPDRRAVLEEALAEIDRTFRDVESLIVTHPHPDHVGLVTTVVDEGDPTVYAPAGIRERLQRDPDALRERARENLRAAGFEGEWLATETNASKDSLTRAQRLLPVDAVDVWVTDGERFAAGDLTFEAIHTPGHQADHCCYATELNGEATLFSGDMSLSAFRAALIHDGYDDGYRDAVPAYVGALDRLAAEDADRVYPGHGEIHTSFEAAISRDRRSLERRQRQVLELIEQNSTTAATISVELAGNHDLRYIAPEVMGVLAYLKRQDDVRLVEADGVAHYERN